MHVCLCECVRVSPVHVHMCAYVCPCVCVCLSVSIYHIFLNQPSVDRPLGCFHVFAIVHSAAVNIGVRVCF